MGAAAQGASAVSVCFRDFRSFRGIGSTNTYAFSDKDVEKNMMTPTGHAEARLTAPDGHGDGRHGGVGRSGVASAAAMHWLSGHRMTVKVLLAAVVLAATVMELMTDPPRDALAWGFVAVECSLILAFPIRSRLASLGLAACFALYYMIPTNGGGSEYWAVWLALAYAGYAMSAWVAALAVLLDAAVYLTRIGMLGLPLSGYVMVALILAVVAFLGRCMRWRDDSVAAREERIALHAREQRLQERLEALRKDEEAALDIHDSVTGNLAYLAMVLEIKADQEHDGGVARSDDAERLYRALSAKVNETLLQVRRIADFLRNPDDAGEGSDPEGEGDGTDFAQLLRREMRCSDAALAQLGFTGRSVLDVPPSVELTDDGRKAALSFLRETYTNIGVHGSASGTRAESTEGADGAGSMAAAGETAGRGNPSGRYSMSVAIRDGKFVIDSSNDAAGAERFASKPVSGMGLDLHARAVARLNGSVRYGLADGRWHVRMELPLASQCAPATE